MDTKKIFKSYFANIEFPQGSAILHDQRELFNKLIYKLDNVVIEGLKRKDFEFESKFELEQFVKEHCRVVDNVIRKEKVYFVDDIPFLVHNYTAAIGLPIEKDRSVTISASLGTYKFL